jgi:hypothetical protein
MVKENAVDIHNLATHEIVAGKCTELETIMLRKINQGWRRTGGIAQVAQCLVCKPEALSSNPNTVKKKVT